MGYIFKNENPYGKMVDDCVIRAIATATGQSWDRTASNDQQAMAIREAIEAVNRIR